MMAERLKCLTMAKLFTNQKEGDRAIQAALDQYNEVYSNNSSVKHQRSRHTKSKTQAQRKLRRNRERVGRREYEILFRKKG